ncbi:hypothetical protein D3C75_1092620 [compost metagenome]
MSIPESASNSLGTRITFDDSLCAPRLPLPNSTSPSPAALFSPSSSPISSVPSLVAHSITLPPSVTISWDTEAIPP